MTEMLLKNLVIRAVNIGRQAYLWLLVQMSLPPAPFLCFSFPLTLFLSFPPALFLSFPPSKKIPGYSKGLRVGR